MHTDSRVNVGPAERTLCLIGAGLLGAWALRRRTAAAGLAVAAAGSLAHRGASGYCALYDALGVSTVPGAEPEPHAVRPVPGRRHGDLPFPPEPHAGPIMEPNPHNGRLVPKDAVQEASEESFPSSDPPAWRSSRV